MPPPLRDCKRLVLKVGSSLLTDAGGALRAEWLTALCEDIQAIGARGIQVIVVTSGAVALGRGILGVGARALRLEEKQAAAACGQILLVQAWRERFSALQLGTAQVLLTIDDSDNRRRYLNARSTLETLLSHAVIPVINENDTVATAELRVGDNDRLAARVAQMVSADTLLLFSDIDGLYTGNPHHDASATRLTELREVTPAIEAMAGGSASSVGSGGMVTKLQAAKIALAAGCHMAIASGVASHPLRALEEGGPATWFLAASTPQSARKHWIGGAIAPQGSVTVDEGAAEALQSGKSLLPAGVVTIHGSFERGDAVTVQDRQGHIIAKGLIAYSSDDALRILGRRSDQIETILGFKGRAALIHRDDMALMR